MIKTGGWGGRLGRGRGREYRAERGQCGPGEAGQLQLVKYKIDVKHVKYIKYFTTGRFVQNVRRTRKYTVLKFLVKKKIHFQNLCWTKYHKERIFFVGCSIPLFAQYCCVRRIHKRLQIIRETGRKGEGEGKELPLSVYKVEGSRKKRDERRLGWGREAVNSTSFPLQRLGGISVLN